MLDKATRRRESSAPRNSRARVTQTHRRRSSRLNITLTTTTPKMDPPPHRQRRVAPSPPSAATSSTTSPRTPTASRTTLQRLTNTLSTLLLTTLALALLPSLIHILVAALATIHETTGRRTPAPSSPWHIGLGTVALAAWHVVLVALSVRVIARGGTRAAWSRVLGRVVVPGYLGAAGVVFGWGVWRKVVLG